MAKKSETDKMLDSIRQAIGDCKASERETYEALCSESDGWEMRLSELEAEDEDEDEE